MARVHISDDGQPRPCTAQPGNCRFGEDDHFESEREAAMFMMQAERRTQDPNQWLCMKCGGLTSHHANGWCDTCADEEFAQWKASR